MCGGNGGKNARHCYTGSIPACAGETATSPASSPARRVYPRVCGGNPTFPRIPAAADGLSPRVRGKHCDAVQAGEVPGSIPACAGETINCRKRAIPRGVYPRVCGGNHVQSAHRVTERGLSPRVRGKPKKLRFSPRYPRSIPACAGETDPGDFTDRFGEVYPRVCGGNGGDDAAADDGKGLSPRVRGKPVCGHSPASRVRSIPACAGETRHPAPPRKNRGVYPRVCGGNTALRILPTERGGLSPRVRGKR